MTSEEEPKKPARKWGILGAIGAFLAKSAKVAKVFKFAAPLVTMASMTISAFAYSFVLGPWLAIGLVGMIFIHEMGHFWAFRFKGQESSMPVFIPFIGAAIRSKGFGNRNDEAFIGIMGPVAGGIGAFALLLVWFAVRPAHDMSLILLTTVATAAWINLFNLIPAKPLDGGRVMQAVGDWILVVGSISLAILAVITQEMFLMFIVLVGISEMKFLPKRVHRAIECLLFGALAVILWREATPNLFWVLFCKGGFALCAIFSLACLVKTIRPDLLERVDQEEAEDAADLELTNKAPLPLAQRLIWCLSYFVLAGALIVLLVWTKTHLAALLPPR